MYAQDWKLPDADETLLERTSELAKMIEADFARGEIDAKKRKASLTKRRRVE
jgi:hypothetical protein